MAKQLKKPWASAILNFLLPGLGYVYTGKRIGFGVGLILTGVILWSSATFSELPLIVWVDSILMAFLFAYDGYKTAEEVNQKK